MQYNYVLTTARHVRKCHPKPPQTWPTKGGALWCLINTLQQSSPHRWSSRSPPSGRDQPKKRTTFGGRNAPKVDDKGGWKPNRCGDFRCNSWYMPKKWEHMFFFWCFYIFFYVGEHEWTWVKGKNRAFLFDDKPKWWNKDRTVRILEDLVLWSEATTSEVPALPEMWYCKQFFLTYMLTQKHMRTFINIWGFPKMGVPPNHYF